ncbi:protein obstructor-E-like [Topomyia yanbarensis]|uniref:protein obstructor-E-like n=1 Tax=Topomyia yanbarensis TaxID=2498891 RepID=UPI00273A81E3|nr:protein obstructor-E-like [Topomyia yanbarensis]
MTSSALKLTLLVAVLAGSTAEVNTDDIACHPTDTHFVDDPRQCNKYFTCYQGIAFPKVCPPGFRFIEALQACYQATVDECFNCPDEGLHFFEHPESCRKYVLCYSGKPNVMECSEGMMFNPVEHQCDLESNVVCNRNEGA